MTRVRGAPADWKQFLYDVLAKVKHIPHIL